MSNRVPQIPLYDLKLPEQALKNAVQTLKSGWLSTGKNVKQFEAALAAKLDVRHAIATNSATTALVATLGSMGITGEVITTPFTFVATVEAICLTGGQPVLADIDPATLNIDPNKVQQLVTSRRSAIVAVDFAGHPCDYDALSAIAKEANIPLIIDASHSLGATYHDQTMGEIGDAAIYSFHATKNLVCGEGGLIATNNDQLAERARLRCRHGITAIASERKEAGLSGYDVVDLGLKGTMSELHAAVGLGHLEQFDKNQQARAALAARYLEQLAQYKNYLKLPSLDQKATPAWHLFVIQLKLDRFQIDRDRFIAEMAALGIECGVHFKPVNEFSYYRQLASSDSPLPVASAAGRQVVTIPLYPTLTESGQDRVIAALAQVIDQYGRK
jgi:dTDP-4-amino-4,6-dideoxygalactose transaminase